MVWDFFPNRLLKKRNPKKQHEMIHNSYEVAPWKIDQICWTARSASDTKNSNFLYRVPKCCIISLDTYQGLYKNRVMNNKKFLKPHSLILPELLYSRVYPICIYSSGMLVPISSRYLFAEFEISYFESKLKKNNLY